MTLLLGPIGDVLEDRVAAAAGRASRNSSPWPCATGSGCSAWSTTCSTSPASRPAGRARCACETDVATFTAELAGIFRAATERAGLRLTVDCPPLDRPAFVDPRMWEKVVVNLLANAVKYTFVGGIHVALRPDGDCFVLTVSDTGVGIVAEELPQLFHRFHRVAGATARTREGTGIGLALVHELAALHGGDVSVESEPGIGSTFTVDRALRRARRRRGRRTARPSARRTPRAARRRAGSEDTSRPAGPATGPAPAACSSSTTTPTCAPT